VSNALAITLKRNGAQLGVHIARPQATPAAAMMLGRSPEDVANLMPRIFNLCGEAQRQAVQLSLGMPHQPGDLRREILRDHLAKLYLHWPRLMGLASQPLPANWAEGGAALARALWGGERPRHLSAWLRDGQGVAPVLLAIAGRFAPGEAVADLPPLTAPLEITAQENSPAARVAVDPLMQQAAEAFGKGPLWRALGRLVECAALCALMPATRLLPDGTALVPAARGTYAFRAKAEGDLVTALERVTPTDHLTAPGGVLETAFASLPADKASAADLLIDILDPCVPVLLREEVHA